MENWEYLRLADLDQFRSDVTSTIPQELVEAGILARPFYCW